MTRHDEAPGRAALPSGLGQVMTAISTATATAAVSAPTAGG